MDLCEFANQLGIQNCLDFNPEFLVLDERIRSYCTQNRCGNYGKSYMCPPLVPPLDIIKGKLRKFHSGVLFQYTINIDAKSDWERVRQSMVSFHNKILEMEEFLKRMGNKEVWGMTAGTCGLCEVCRAESQKPCAHPDKARASLEALGIDVIALLTKLELDNQFYADKIIWTGGVLF
jgi:predicted metal-binding protein